MLLVSLHERIRRFNNEKLLMTAIEATDDPALSEAIEKELDMRSMLARPLMAQRKTPQPPSLLRWLDPATRPNLSDHPGKRSA